MTTAEHLETIDRLRAQGFPETRVRSGAVTSGPGYHLAELGPSRWYGDEDAADRAVHEDQLAAEYGSLVRRLEDRWGASDMFGLTGLRLEEGGGETAEPWREMIGTADHLHLWRAGNLWVAVYAAHWGADHSPQIMAVVTEIDPP
ncbi:hypothetical protein EF903_15475 [Streptomyces sp. WAC05292]|uniref:hypothetical protein n=1 Tax=Streptomyces sp. WAC05292 TaxID=2487418 RepID=UPI000F73CBFD|nr:hypothetical protein [Streptomyces sp. WAC05292]RSS88515.1 hypothetical protein EF903_15475 [Streptomyces sp. WAC05292]